MSDPPPPSGLHRPGALRRSPVPLATSSSIAHNANPSASPSHPPPESTRPRRRQASKPITGPEGPVKPQKSPTAEWSAQRRAGDSSKELGKAGSRRDDRHVAGETLGKTTSKKIQKANKEVEYVDVLKARIEALERRNEKLLREIEIERARAEEEKQKQENLQMQKQQLLLQQEEKESQDDIISRLLAANDASLPSIPPASSESHPKWDFQLTIAPGDVPSVKPLPFGLKELTTFSKLRFSAVSTIPIAASSPDSPGLTTATTVSGRVQGTKLWFRIVFHTTTIPSVQQQDPSSASPLTESSSTTTPHPLLEDDIFISSIPIISLPTWTHPELRPLITHVHVTNDLSHLLYALDSYGRVSQLRAECWRKLKFPPAPGRRVAVIPIELKRSRKVELVVRWGIEIDDVGEAKSRVEGEVRVPAMWREKGQGEWERFGRLFRGLVKERGVAAAVKGVRRVLGGE